MEEKERKEGVEQETRELLERSERSERGERRSREPHEDQEERSYQQKRIQILKFIFKKKKCRVCKSKQKEVDYKDIEFISKFVSDRGKIIPRRISGCCAKHQRMVKQAVKRARYMALLPFLKVEKINK